MDESSQRCDDRYASPQAAAPQPGTLCVHELFESQAAQRPDAIALSFAAERLTYAELDARANRLARWLRRRGVGPESLIGIAVERSVAMVVAMLGVLKAGGAYIPFDPGYPPERLRFMWRDSRSGLRDGAPSVLLSESRLREILPAGEDEIALLDEDWPEIARLSGEPLNALTVTDQLAYVIYTSGSSGRPKGVLIAHRGVVNVVQENIRLLEIDAESRVLQLATASFDASVLEIFSALLAGAHLVLTPRQTLMSGDALGAELAAKAITTMAIPPSLLDKVPEGTDFPALHGIVVGGEAISAATANRWSRGRILINAYAPTEATIYATAQACDALPYEEAPGMGRAIAATRTALLDAAWNPTLEGQVGEIHLGGVGLARGYLGRPALTAQAFIPSDLGDSSRPGERLYKTGDLGRADEAGNLHFAGRFDHQVKVRGVRMELGEIEQALSRHPAVRSAVVEARPPAGGGDRRLVAYFVPRDSEAAPTAAELRGHLSRSLPEAMIPSAFTSLDALPMTPTGKVDRRALPEPTGGRPQLSTPFVAPQGELATQVAALWEELLGVQPVGVEDNLFELGGHSLVVAQISARLRDELGLKIPLVTFFEKPTLSLLLPELEDGGGKRATVLEPPPIHAVDRSRPLPVSFPQEQIWFLAQLAPESIAYNFQFTLRLRGRLQVDLLEATFAEVIRRHEILRTRFPALDGQPAQVVGEPWQPRIPVVDLVELGQPERGRLREALVLEAIGRSFDLDQPPLLAWVLLRLGTDDHMLVHVEHHFVHDGWSLAVFLAEVQEIYDALQQGREPELEELPVQFGDFAVWQREWLDGDVLEGELAYWRERLGGELPTLELPIDRPRPAVHSFRGGALRVDLDPDLYAELREFGRRQGTTLFMAMLATFQTLLLRYTGQRDLILGSGLANRRLRELESLIGMVVNTVVLRTQVGGELSFLEMLHRARDTTLETHQHQDVPVEKLVAELQPNRDLSRNPIFQTLFSFHDAPVPDLGFGGMEVDLFERHNGSAKADLNVVVKPRAEQRVGRQEGDEDNALTMVWEYSVDLFDRSTIERMWGHFQVLLGGAVASPERRIRDLPLLSEAEIQELERWNQTTVDFGPFEACHLQVERRAFEAGDAVALVAGEAHWTLAELHGRAEELAELLRGAGIAPGELVAVVTERSAETVIAAHGCLLAGAAYLPLDPKLPSSRLGFMIEDSGARAVVFQPSFQDLLPPVGAPVLAVDVHAPRRPVSLAAAWRPAPQDLAYVIYTSGSSGLPKGVEVPHRGLANLVAWHRRAYGLEPAETAPTMAQHRAALVAGPAFDAAVWELWPALCSGGCLHVPPDELRTAPEGLVLWAVRERLRTLFLTTPLAEAVLEQEANHLSQLVVDSLLTGGDRLRRRPRGDEPFRLLNHYGPTENSVVTTVGPVVAETQVVAEANDAAPTIGRALPNQRIYVLDRDRERLPVGVPGELCIAGAGLARGYRHRPALTAQAFVPNPLGGADGSPQGDRLYRSGDLVRWRPGGELEFVGRIDQQVKVRGFRIELGEIEAVLTGHPAIAEAVVLAPEDGDGQRRLVAFLTPGADAADDLHGDLKSYLSGHLPEYMVPSAIQVLEALPLTANGKVDRRALAEMEVEDAADGAERVAPRTPLEELVAGVWSDVLGAEGVGVHESFFDLGGHSLLATRVVSRLHKLTSVELPVAVIFETPTIAGVADELARRSATGGSAAGHGEPPPAIRPLPRNQPLPASFAQERLWFLDRFEKERSAYNVPAVYRMRGRLEIARFRAALEQVVRRHEILRTTFSAAEGQVFQVVAEPAPVPVSVVDLGSLADAQREATFLGLARAEALRPFDLAVGPLLRCRLLRLGDDDHALFLPMHHTISDGWSMGILLDEIGAFYAADEDSAPPLPEPGIQYADFAAWQRHWLSGAELERQLAYWREALAEAPATLNLPTDRPRPARLSSLGARRWIRLDPGLSGELERLSRRHGATLFMTLLAAFKVVLARQSGQGDLLVGTPVANRNRVETEGLVGLLLNTLVVRSRQDDDPAFAELLARLRHASLGAFAHQDLPFEKLVEELRPERDLTRTPFFQVMFILQTAPAARAGLPGVELQPVETDRGTSKFDLTLSLQPTPAGLRGRLDYRRDLFDETTILRLWRQVATVCRAVAADPERPVSLLPLMSAGEAHQVSREWAAGPALEAPPEAQDLDSAFRRAAARTPDRLALVCESPAGDGGWREERLSFGALDARAEAWARSLRADGLAPEEPVALHLPRGAAALAALLGVSRAGGAFLPLDSKAPAERAAAILRAARCRRVITDATGEEALRAALPELEIRRQPGTETAPKAERGGIDPASLAYLIFTSGSTGEPKGVAVEHRQALAYARGLMQRLGLSEDSGGMSFAGVTTLAADLGHTALLPALVTGGTLHWISHRRATDPAAFGSYLRSRRIGLLKIVPSHLAALLGDRVEADLLPTRHLVLGGEAADPEAAASWAGAMPHGRVWNHYGPTEGTVGALTWSWDPAALAGGARSLPIGRSLPAARAWVLDRHLRPLPPGVPGELFLGGPGVARGYLHRPVLTAEAFRPEPEGAGIGTRIYATGDRARRLADGTVEFLGRVDDQVKLRGFRVEPGEVAAVLEALPGVAQAAVLLRQDLDGGPALVAYAVAAQGTSREGLEESWLAALGERLPEYMRPAALLLLEDLPRTANGKLDRAALPAPASGGAGAGVSRAPRGAAEELVAEVWGELLGRDNLQAASSFFDLGGHSLLVIQMLSRLRDRGGVELPPPSLFEAPTLAAFARRVEAAQGSGKPSSPPLRPATPEERAALSPAQRRFWFLARLEPDSPAYHLPFTLLLDGELEPRALSTALAYLVERHEILRTRYPTVAGEPRALVIPRLRIQPVAVDLSGLPFETRDAVASELGRRGALRPFDLDRGPVLRAALLRLGEDEHHLLLDLHHIATDGASMEILRRDLAAAYEATITDRAGSLHASDPAAGPLGYADFAAWQSGVLEAGVLDDLVEHWQRRLAGSSAPLELPTDRPRSGVVGKAGEIVERALPASLRRRVEALGRSRGATPFMTLLAAFQTLLARLTGSWDLRVGTPVAGRPLQEVEGLVGCFVNTLVLRTALDPRRDLATAADAVRETVLDALAHQDLPFEHLVEVLAPDRDLAVSPLFQVTFALREPTPEQRAGGLALRSRPRHTGTAKFDLSLFVREDGDGWSVAAEYRSELFDPTTVRRWLEAWEVLLDGAARRGEGLDQPGAPATALPLAFLPLASPAARQQLLVEVNDRRGPAPLETPLHELIARRARQAPDAVALIAPGASRGGSVSPGESVLTYGALLRQTEGLARRLRARGVRPGVRVGLCVEASPEGLVALLAILRAGGAYVPLDPAYPAERLDYMVADSGAALLVGRRGLLDRLPNLAPEVPHLDLDALELELELAPGPEDGLELECEAGPEDLAYVLYTSGSTGKPKGALVAHRGLSNLSAALAADLGTAAGERVLLFAPLSFDTSVFEICLTLTAGAALVLLPRDELLPGPGLLRRLARHRVERITLTPSALAALPEGCEDDPQLGSLRAVAVAGEACPQDLAGRWRRSGRRFWNAYGPTENTVWASVSRPDGSERPTIGGPVLNKALYVVDAAGEPSPMGVPGELAIGGEGLAWGYQGRPGRSAEVFVPDAFGLQPGGRLYRSGDLVRRRRDGQLDFLGRVDHQVKIRGFRIEPGEIEAALVALPAVAEAAVVLRGTAGGEARLVAYVVAPEGASESRNLQDGELRGALRGTLPEHMVPSLFVTLPALPRTPSDKIDRSALPAPEEVEVGASPYVAPRSAAEARLAKLWQDLLGGEPPSMTASFFEIGGHSLLAAKMVGRAAAELGVELGVRQVFEHPTIAELAPLLETAEESPAAAIAPRIAEGPAPLSFAQERLLFLHRFQPDDPTYNITAAFDLGGAVDEEALSQAVADLVDRHEVLRSRFFDDGEGTWQTADGAVVPLAVEWLPEATAPQGTDPVTERIRGEANAAFDLARGPVFRATLLRLDGAAAVLILAVHHIAADGVSMGLLLRDLATFYRARLGGREARLPDLPVQVADIAAWQRRYVDDAALGAEIDWWRRRLSDPPPPVELPLDRPRQAVREPRGALWRGSLPAASEAALERAAQTTGATRFAVLTAAFGSLLARYSSASRVTLGTPVAGRSRPEMEELVGCFVNTLVLPMALDLSAPFAAAVASVRQVVVDALEHQEVPFERLVAELAPERDLALSPFFQATFSHQREPAVPGELAPGLSLTPRPSAGGGAKFDLSWLVIDGTRGGLQVVEYDAALFDETTVERMAGHLATLLAGWSEARSLLDLPLMSEGEERQVLADWATHPGAAPLDRPLPELVAHQAERAPERIALYGEVSGPDGAALDEAWTYAALLGRSRRLATLLDRQGVGPESRVALHLARSPLSVIAMLAVHQAGGAFVPLDPRHPAERSAFVLADAGTTLLLSDGKPPAGLREAETGVAVLRLDELAEEDWGALPARAESAASAEHLAYVLYTSGSTGRPKGALIGHRGLSNLAEAMVQGLRVESGERLLVMAPLTFDTAIFEIVQGLHGGASVHLLGRDAVLPGPDLLERLARHRIGRVTLTPSALAALPGEAAAALPHLRYLTVAGEACAAELVDRWAPGRRFVNAYGPTENTVWASGAVCRAGEGKPVIGGPVLNKRLFVLDRHLRPLPQGLPGELVIGGEGLARGYLGRPARTAAAFVPDPFGDAPGERLYRSGDRARWRSDGQLDFLGRIDQQIKIRGVRIEPGEVEALLLAQPEVAEAAVIARDYADGPRLLAYWVPEGPSPQIEGAELRRRLAERLPAALVPAAVTRLQELPRTAHDKIDRTALPEPGPAAGERPLLAPRNPLEEILADLWREVLGIDTVGVEDDFFELGGHSLLAGRLIARIESRLGRRLQVRALFEAPSVAGLARRIADSAARRALPPVIPRPNVPRLPLGAAQRRLWVLDRLEPGSAAYNVPASIRLEGSLDAKALEFALAEVVRRHEALRTRFQVEDGEPWQEVDGDLHLWRKLPVVDLAGLPAAGRLNEARRLAGIEARAPFDLQRGPLCRLRLLRLAEDDHALLFDCHHTIFDGASMEVVWRELELLYAAAIRGEEAELPPVALQYGDFALWQQEHRSRDEEEALVEGWRRRLEGAPQALALPTDRPRPALAELEGGVQRRRLPPALADDLEALARRHGATPFMLGLALFATFLGRISGQGSVLVGTPVAGRPRPELEEVVGFFANTLVLRADPRSEASFAALLESTRDGAVDAYVHQDLPFERLVEALQPRRDLSRNPLFQAMFAYQDGRGGRPGLPGLRISRLELPTRLAKVDLALDLVRDDEGLELGLDYATALFDGTTMARFAGHLATLLEGVVAAPERPLRDVAWLGAAERHQLVHEWNDTATAPVDGLGIHQRVVAQAIRRPDSLALRHGDESMTYGELLRRARLLGGRLLRAGSLAASEPQAGGDPGRPIAIVLERSPDLLIAQLAVLLVGAPYLPIDPEYPAARRAFMLEDSGASLLVCGEGDAAAVPGLPTVVLEPGWATAPGEPAAVTDLASVERTSDEEVGDELAAYVLYTSGSTGRPKGVQVSHRALSIYLAQVAAGYGPGPGESMMLFASASFDVSVEEIWATLCAGALVEIREDSLGADPRRILGWAGDRRTRVLSLPTVLFQEAADLLHRGEIDWPADARAVVFGGERLLPGPAERWLSQPAAERVEVFNVYGPTEGVIGSTSWRLNALEGPRRGQREAPIGRPLPGYRMHLLSADLRPVPIGVTGEIFLGDPALAHGYRGRPAQTAERFLPDPLGPRPGGRLYRTGDRGRLRPDGLLDFLGRVDEQIQLRGFRVEVGEIEALLERHPGVAECAVVPQGEGERLRLVAYWAADGTAGAVDEAALRRALEVELPAHMVPSLFVRLETLPRTPNDKIDREALPAPQPGPGDDAGRVPPRTPLEELLAGVWREVLEVEEVGVHDDFFASGGHSLLATRWVARAEALLNRQIGVRALFESPTLAELAERLGATDGLPALPPVLSAERHGPLPLGSAQRRLWVLDRLEPGSAAYNVPAAIRLRGVLVVAALHRSLELCVHRHESLRTRFVDPGGEPRQVVDPPSAWPLPMVDLTGLGDEGALVVARHLAAREAGTPFDLATGPLCRGALLRLARLDHALLFDCHHSVFDGASMEILWRELAAAYNAGSAGEEPALPPVALQYGDFALWQQAYRGEEAEAELLDHWRERLAEAPQTLELPLDRLRPPLARSAGAEVWRRLPVRVAQAFEARSRQAGATPFMTGLALFAAFLSRLSRQRTVLLGTPVAGRPRPELEEVVGFFANTLVLRADLEPGATFQDALAAVRVNALDAYAHQDLPFERLVEALQPERDLSRNPIFQTMFGFQDARQRREDLAGLEVSSLSSALLQAKVDLALDLVRRDDALLLRLEYASDLFDATTLQRWARQLEALLEEALARPEAPLDEIRLLSAAEEHAVLREWNDSHRSWERPDTLPRWVAEQIERRPEAVAVVFGDRCLTYGELDDRGRRLAGRLRVAGAGAEIPVALALRHGLALPVAQWAVMLAGAAWVPLDPEHPAERLQFMLRDSGAAVLVSQGSGLESLAAALDDDALPRVTVDDQGHLAGPETDPGARPLPRLEPLDEQLAYVLYTSGSTGRPKGVEVSHGALRNYLLESRRRCGPGSGRRSLCFSSASFDGSVEELWSPLAQGATVVLREDAMAESPAHLAAEIEDRRIHLATLPTPLFHELAGWLERNDAPWPAVCRSIVIGGDKASREPVARWLGRPDTSGVRVHNAYGPTEATIAATDWTLRPTTGEIPIGRPLANYRAVVADDRLRPQPIGLPGEILLGGAGLARGYRYRPGLTAERFVPDGRSAEPGARLYRTGDLARWLVQGDLEFLGRADDQVQLRGFRIELGEVENALHAHPGILAAAVLLREDAAGEPRLVAYWVGSDDGAATPEVLQTALKERLPQYMIPTAWVELEALPLTANGKLDHRALPTPGTSIGAEAGYVAPRSDLEGLLADLLAEILEVQRVGIHDNFFELGGHSLTAIRATARIYESLEIEISLHELFTAPTVAELTVVIGGKLLGGD